MLIIVCLTALVATTTASATPSVFSCPDLTVLADFDATAFDGTWYKQYGLNTPWEIGTCSQATYTNNATSGVISIATRLKTIIGGTEEVSGSAVFADSSSTAGNLNLTMHTYVGDLTASMMILDTDYTNFAVIYHCNSVSISWISFPFESVWVITRDRELTVATALLIEESMSTISAEGGPSMSMLSDVSQKNCD